MPDVDVIVVGAGPAGSCAALDAGARRSVGDPHRTRPVPGLEEHVRRRGVPPRARRPPAELVGGSAGPTVDHPPGDDVDDADASAHHRLPHHRVGGGAVQRDDDVPARLRLVARRPGRGGGRTADLLDHRHGTAPRGRRAGRRRADRPARRRADGIARDRLRRRQLVPGEGGRSLRRGRRGQLHPRRQRDAGVAEGRDRRALQRARARRRRHRGDRLHRSGERWRLRLHEPRHGRDRRRAQAAQAGRAVAPAGGDHRRLQGAPRDRTAHRGVGDQGVLGPPHPRGGMVDDPRAWRATVCSSPGMPPR